MRIRLIGQKNNSGIGIHYTNFCRYLSLMQGVEFEIEEIPCESQQVLLNAAATSRDQDINICWTAIDIKGYFRGLNIQWVVFESTVVPAIMTSCLQNADLLWVPSKWGKQVLINNGYNADRIDVVPEGVDACQFHPYYKSPPTDPLQFLFIGKYESRKSVRETLQAWKQAFGDDPGVKLTVKTHVFSDDQEKLNEVRELLDNLGLRNAIVLWGAYDDQDIQNLYRQSHVFVLPTKGEGWGLPLIEAAASGLPIVTTNYSAHSEFLPHSSCVFVDYHLSPINCEFYKSCYPNQTDWGLWAQPNVNSIAQALVAARENYAHLRQQAEANASQVREHFAWSQCSDAALAVLKTRKLLN